MKHLYDAGMLLKLSRGHPAAFRVSSLFVICTSKKKRFIVIHIKRGSEMCHTTLDSHPLGLQAQRVAASLM